MVSPGRMGKAKRAHLNSFADDGHGRLPQRGNCFASPFAHPTVVQGDLR
jgi:hypothetical protein